MVDVHVTEDGRDFRWMGVSKSFPFQVPTQIEFGPGVTSGIGDAAAALGHRPLLVTDPGVVAAGGGRPARRAARECRPRHPGVLLDIEANPRAETVDATAAAGRAHGADMVIAVGGGSALDSGKGAAAVLTHGGSIFDYEGLDKVPGPTVPVIAVPTTAGTGSEVTAWSIVIDPARNYKMAIGGAHLSPRLAFVDPELTLSLPSTFTAMTGVDALTHAIEAFTARCSNGISDGLALYAVELISGHIEHATADGDDIEARSGMLLGSLIAGLAFGNADTAAVHAMAEALGGVMDIPHGVANAMCLPHVMRFNLAAVPDKTARLGRAMGLAAHDLPVDEAAAATVDGVTALLKRLGTPSLHEMGVSETDIPALVASPS